MSEPELMPVAKRREQKFKLGIIGYGYVGKAVDYIFSTPTVEKMTIDPKYNENTLKDLCDWNPSCVFICLPTPSKEDGSVDSKDIDEAVMRLVNQTDAFIVIKSTVTPDTRTCASAAEKSRAWTHRPRSRSHIRQGQARAFGIFTPVAYARAAARDTETRRCS